MNLRGAKADLVMIDDLGFAYPAPRRIRTFQRESKLYIDKTPYHYADPIMYSFAELEEMAYWCHDTFGPRGYRQHTMELVWDFNADPDYIFWFKEEKHLMMFKLRWS